MSVSIAQYRQRVPALQNKAYFNYGGQGPMVEAALAAIHSAHQTIQTRGPFGSKVYQWMRAEGVETRRMLADDLGVSPQTLALTENVTVGCNIALWGLPWRSGDHILLSDCEHPGIIATVQELQRRYGIEFSIFPHLSQLNSADPVSTIQAHLRPTTRLLVISHILWNTGQVLPLKAICQLCHERPQPVRVLSDSAQSVGMLPLQLAKTGVDFYAFTGHKWYCGPAGLGGLYVRPEAMAELSPTYIGWRGITLGTEGQPTGWEPDARRYEVSTSNVALCSGLRVAIATHNDWGTTEERYFRICQLSSSLWGKLNSLRSVRCLLKSPPESGLVSFRIFQNGAPAPTLHQKLVVYLETRQFYLRTLLSPSCVRACTHYFTTESEIDRLIDAIEEFLQSHAW
ncbi:aminotransferase class V-fold PLP-dependent enzyme [Leptolyngbya cf. ectocarpi LEGE 11479]|uniref:Aminotransferase class V-fold PLP-dependent enzyme n=1 Tax=Leptolyngbya cf. ectocarpi LEGE 11479 TaxID=1828722 RepID=A0A928WZ44_LEPEC|nr:aminotransferase class V-fold PLP-dependent enzyme [Leptolyngbya ectocarpi]MBE9066120.1 aminotransferase class V-fold PLP-dependent enzyme [Leptolyngbya cf. ectocarpi LEGE 11479]